MKCQNCGKNEVNFHYSSNVNGNITQAHLCSQCAAQAGYDLGSMFSTRSMFGDFFGTTAGQRLMPATMLDFDPMSMFITWPQARALPTGQCECDGTCETPIQENPMANIDEDMQKRRELNIMREQMRCAAENEDFEKAAEIRDRLKEMEAE